MGLAYYIVLDTEEPGFDTEVNGKALAHALDELDALCDDAGLERLDSFMGQSADDFSDLLGEDIEFPEGEDMGNEWFEPQEGIALIDALCEKINANPEALDEADAVLEDLEDYKRVLVQADSIGAKWFLAIDI